MSLILIMGSMQLPPRIHDAVMNDRCGMMASIRKTTVFCITFLALYILTDVIIYKEMFLGCDWLIRVQLIPNITQNSAKICNTVQKSVKTVQKSVTTVQKSVTTVQKSVISSLSDGIYSLKNQKYGGRIFTFA